MTILDQKSGYVKLDTVTLDQLNKAIDKVKVGSAVNVRIKSDSAYLSLDVSTEGQLRLEFMGSLSGEFNHGYLLNSSSSNNNELIRFRTHNGQIDEIHENEVIDLALATETMRHFLIKGDLPDDTKWRGQMPMN